MKTSKVLTHAKRYLATTYKDRYDYAKPKGREKFICSAIMTAASHTKRITNGDIERCRKMIVSRLEGFDTLEGWLMHKCCNNKEWLWIDRATEDRIQQHRHAWLDQMITEFKSKGD